MAMDYNMYKPERQAGVKLQGTGLDHQHPKYWKSSYSFWLPKNLPTNSLLFTGSLTDSINS